MTTANHAAAQAPFAIVTPNLFAIRLSGSAAWQVLCCILSYANKDGTAARPKIRSIVEGTSLSRRAVLYAIKELEAVGLLARQRRRKDGHQDSSLYAIDKTAECNMVHSAGCNSSAPLRPDPFLPDPSATNVAAFSLPKMRANPPSRLLDRVIALLEWERGKAGARTLGVQWHDICGAEALKEAVEAAEADAAENGQTCFEFFWNWFQEECGVSYGELAPKTGPRRKRSKSKPPQPMPSFSEMRQARKTAVKVNFKTAWRDPRLRHHALEYGRGRGLSDKEINQHFDVYKGRNEDLVRNDWLLNWTAFLSRRLRPAPANPWAMSRY